VPTVKTTAIDALLEGRDTPRHFMGNPAFRQSERAARARSPGLPSDMVRGIPVAPTVLAFPIVKTTGKHVSLRLVLAVS